MNENQRPVSSPVRGRRSLSQQWLTQVVTDQLAQHSQESATVVDLGGGTGGLAATLAAAGHQVWVVDPSPDALAATQRRAAEMDLTDRLQAIQGDTATLAEVVAPGSVDAVLCHLVLQRRTEAEQALRTIAGVLAPGGVVSILIAQRYQQVLRRVMSGNVGAARELLADTELVDRDSLRDQLAGQGWQVLAEHGIGVVADQVPETAVEGQYAELFELESELSRMPQHLESAARLHLLATR